MDGKLVPVPEKAHGVFFGGDSCVILYTYQKDGEDNHIVYFWQACLASTFVLPLVNFFTVNIFMATYWGWVCSVYFSFVRVVQEVY